MAAAARSRVLSLEAKITGLQRELLVARSEWAEAVQSERAVDIESKELTDLATRLLKVADFEWRPGQLRASLALCAGRDVLAILATGSGKTLVWLLKGYQALQTNLRPQERRARSIVTAPLRELLLQHHATTLELLGPSSSLIAPFGTATAAGAAVAKPSSMLIGLGFKPPKLVNLFAARSLLSLL